MAAPERLPAVLGGWEPLPLPSTPLSSFFSVSSAASSSGSVSNFTMETQAKKLWCWAAVAVSVARKYKPQTSWQQCTLATKVFGQNGLDCCSGGNACNKARTLSEAFAKTGHLDGERFLDAQISFEQVCAEIRDDQPFCVRIQWPEDPLIGHFVAVTGFSVGPSGDQYLDVQDPSEIDSAQDNMKRKIPFSECKKNYDKRGGKWTWLYRTKA